MKKVIEVKNLTKKYPDLIAVNKISFYVKAGEIFGLLGENGAGKTTTLEMIEGLRKPTSGNISVLGHRIDKGLNSIKEKIGVQLQASAYYKHLNLEEILDLLGSFYQKKSDTKDLLKIVGLQGKAKSYVGDLSGGLRQKFSIIASLINNPDIVFLDEPTTGLDPLARRKLWDIISEIKSRGKTIILTTHYLEEAEMLCDRVAIMEKGKIIIMGETHKLIEKTKAPFKIRFIVDKVNNKAMQKLSKIGELHNIAAKKNNFEFHLKTRKDLNEALRVIQDLKPESLTVNQANLEDLFIELTGKTIQDEENINA